MRKAEKGGASMLRLLYARGGQPLQEELLERMGRSSAGRKLLIVPEHYSHESERAMCAVLGNGAARSCEVLSFTRLASRLTDAAGGGAAPVLDAGGRMLLMYAALRQVADGLALYRAPSRKPAFLTGLLATVDECKRFQVRPETLIRAGEELGGQQGDKWRDIGLIYHAYERLAAQSAADPRDRLDRLTQQLKQTRWAAEDEVFLYGFSDLSPQELGVVEALLGQCPVTAALVCDPQDELTGVFAAAQRTAMGLRHAARRQGTAVETEQLQRQGEKHPSLQWMEKHLFGVLPRCWQGAHRVELGKTATPRQEVERAAAEVLRLLREEGLRCRDIAVCTRQSGQYGELIESTFAQYGIPVFRSAMSDVLEKPVLALVTGALAAAAEDYPYEEMFRYLKTGLTGLSDQERDLLENYVLTWELRGSAWTRERPWDMHPEGYGLPFSPEEKEQVERLDGLRRRVVEPLERLRKNLDKTGKGHTMALYQMLEEIDLPRRLAQRAAALEERGDLNTAAQYRQLWDILVGGLEQCALLLGDTEMELEEFSRLFTLTLSQYDVGAIPVSLDRVTVGEITRMAGRNMKALFILGADSGAIPDCTPAPGLLSDQDRDALALREVELAPRQEDGLRLEMTVLYEACTRPTQRLYVSYAAGDAGAGEQGPSFLWERLAALFPQSGEAAAFDPRLSAPEPALELAGENRRLRELLRTIPELAQRVERLDKAAGWRRGRLSLQGVHALFGETAPMSATRLDLFNSCHFSHFLRFGMEAKARKPAKFRPSDYGTFVHEVLEKVLGRAGEAGGVAALAADPGLCERMARQEADRYEREVLSGLEGESARLRYLFQRMKQSALAVTQSVAEELAASDFTPIRFELGFGRGQELPPIEVHNGMGLRLSGFVDRVDSWVHEGKRYLRVVDYKTGKKSFDFADVEDGRGLQMLLYLFALTREGAGSFGPEELVPAGVLYVPARNPVVDGDRGMTRDDVAREQARLLRRQGLVLGEQPVLEAMEHTRGSYRFLPVGEGARGGEYLVTGEQLGRLDDYLTAALSRAAGEMAAGNIDADPYWRDEQNNACRWCDYRAACHFEESCGDRARRRKGIRAAEFWDWMEHREEAEHGH